MRHHRVLTATLLAFVALTPLTLQSMAQAAPSVTSADARSDATRIRTDAIALRSQVSTLMQTYLDAYSDRFTTQELSQLKGLKANADRQMAAVVTAVTRLRTAVNQGKDTSTVGAAKTNATRTWGRAKSTAETSWSQARAIIEPKLSLFERLSALNDYNDTMMRFDELGAAISDLPTR